jgi:hypothetical protein
MIQNIAAIADARIAAALQSYATSASVSTTVANVASAYQSADAALQSAINSLTASLAGKQDVLGYTPVNRAGDTMTGPLLFQTLLTGASHDYGFISSSGSTFTIGRNSTAKSTITVYANDGIIAALRGGGFYWSGSTSSSLGGGLTACVTSNTAGVVEIGNGAGGPGTLSCGSIVSSGAGATTLLINRPGFTSFGLGDASGTHFSVASGIADPTPLDLASGKTTRWRNSATGEIRDWINDNGVMKKSPVYV